MNEPTARNLHAVDVARFSAGDEVTDSGTTPPEGTPPAAGRSASKARPERPIPTDRLKFDNQVEVLKQVASMSGNNRKGVDAETMSAAINLRGGTGGLNSRFFRAAGWFEAVGRGEYTASDGLLQYWRHINVDPEDHQAATAGMRSEVKRSWFWDVVGPMLENGHPVREKAMLLQLATAANATDHRAQLETIIDWLVWVGLVRRDGESVVLATAVAAKAGNEISEVEPDNADNADNAGVDEAIAERETDRVDSGEPPARHTGIGDDAIISFNVSVRLTANDVQNLSEEQMHFVMGLAEKLRG